MLHFETKNYTTQPESLDDLRHRKEIECPYLIADVLSNVKEAF